MIAKALVIGVANYAAAPRLPVAVHHDVNDIAAVLRDPRAGGLAHDDVTLLIDNQATSLGIREALARAAATISEEGIFLFYFSGHGDRAVIGGKEQSWLLPHNADLNDLPATALSSDDMACLLRAIGARRQVLMIDACHAGGIGSTKRPSALVKGFGKAGVDALSSGAGRVLLSSSRAHELSHISQGARNSVFTTTLLEAFGGATVDRGDGMIGVLDIFDYVSREVPNRAEQHPVFHAGDLENNFAIARRPVGSHRKKAADAAAVLTMLTHLYPAGPTHDNLWSRAGGDLSRLELGGTGASQWHSALRKVGQGGGGLTLDKLLRVVADDYPGYEGLADLGDWTSQQ